MRIKKSITIFIFLLTAAFYGVSSLLADTFDLLEMSEKLDQTDFLTAIDKANTCTHQHNFTCTDIQLTKASKLANGSRDQQTMLSVRESMVNEKNMMLKEQQRIMEEDRKAQAAQVERLRQQQAAADKSNDFQWGKAAALLGGSMIGGLDKLSSDVQAKVITGILKDSAGGQEGINNFTEVANSRSNTNKPTSSNYNNAIVQSQKQVAKQKTVDYGNVREQIVNSEQRYDYITDGSYNGVGETEQEGCESAMRRGPNKVDITRIISTGTCACTKGKTRSTNYYTCIIPFKAEISSPYNPNAKSSGPSNGVSR